MDLTPIPNYIPNDHHRDGSFSHLKSQWRISKDEEHLCYKKAFNENWLHENCYWGLHLVEEYRSVLGISPSPDFIDLYISKFVGNQNIWHGYPVATWLRPCDKPSKYILDDWKKKGYISSHEKSKIYRGQRCDM